MTETPRRIGIREVIEGASEKVIEFSAYVNDEKGGGGKGSSTSPAPVPYSQDDIAHRFTTRFGDTYVHVAAGDRGGKWWGWNGTRYTEDNDRRTLEAMREICRVASLEPNAKSPREIASDRTAIAALHLATSERVHAVTRADFDSNPWLLNMPNGILDCRTDQIGPHGRAARMTKITGAALDARGLEAAPTWRRFLDDVTQGDQSLQRYLQRLAGYLLTGSTREHVVIIIHGPGGNGKSVFIETLGKVLGDYSTTAAMEVFQIARGERHPTEIAVLAGARLITASETSEGARLNVTKLKTWSGGDAQAARLMRQDTFNFYPQGKIVLVGNHVPRLPVVDEAVRRRFQIVPFQARIEHPDVRLPETLNQELGAILGWAAQGLTAWRLRGLDPPPVVLRASDDYLNSEDLVGRWIDERCALGPDLTMTTAEAHSDFVAWARLVGERDMSVVRLKRALLLRPGIRDWRGRAARGVEGIGLAPRDGQQKFRFEGHSAVEREPGEEG